MVLTCDKNAQAGAPFLSLNGFSISFRPQAPLPPSTDCVLTFTGLKDLFGNLANVPSDGFQLKTEATASGPVTNPRSQYPHTVDGHFSAWTTGADQFEWFDVKPAKGMYTYFYADYDGTYLYALNDWFYNGDRIEPDCYNQFNAWTGGGAEQWEVRAYGDQHVEVRLNGKLVKNGDTGVQGGAGFGLSPLVDYPHTTYEIRVPASPGDWGVQLHDPGPAFICHQLEDEPAPIAGTIDLTSTSASNVLGAGIITGVAPSTSVVGAQITISGVGFGAAQGSSTVSFGGASGTPGTVVSWSDTRIVVTVPVGAKGPITIVGLTASNAFAFTVVPGPIFQPAVGYPAGQNPFSVTIADFNGDQKPDLAVANSGGTNVSVLLGVGDGSFKPQTLFTVGSAPVAVVAADLDGDGKLDLVVANHATSDVSLLLGVGDGTFAAARTRSPPATGTATASSIWRSPTRPPAT